ncbi:MAG: transglutaminase domain-containing protein, partial [Lachnospiraceae bacterium]|nr:transglutaminase domain-containing protein [Lachnospiraceae bacterium]
NLSDSAAGSTLVENDSFVLNGTESGYAAGEDELEYYHTTDRYFDTDVIAGELAALLESDGEAVLRTDYDIDDETFYEIAQEAANQAQKNISGFYWMGVIHLAE